MNTKPLRQLYLDIYFNVIGNVPLELLKINPTIGIVNAYLWSNRMLNFRLVNTSPWTKCLPFHRRYLHMYFRE